MFKKLTVFLLMVSMILGTAVAMANNEDDDDNTEPEHPLVNTQWQLSVIKGESPLSDVMVTLAFDEEGNVFGTGGCNHYNSTYTVDGINLTFGGIASTRMLCSDGGISEQEAAFFSMLEAVDRYELVTKDMLDFFTDDELTLEFLRLPSLDNTKWVLNTFNDNGLVEDSQITLEFDDEGMLGGLASCNHYGGSYEVDGQVLSLGDLFSTEMACMGEGLMDQEAAYLQTLGKVNRYVINNFTLRLLTPEGDVLWFDQVHDLLGTSWKLETIGGEPAIGERSATIYFEQFDHSYGNASCNTFNATYEVMDEGKIIFGIVISTMMACADDLMTQEFNYQAALYGAYAYEVSDDQLTIHYIADDEERELVFSSFVPETE